jgi:catechol 2,3-dioxygenase-like lactoylglutathione lyase family enzyme
VKEFHMIATADLPLGFLGERVQLAFVVRDLDAAIKYWTETLKVGPFVVMETSRGDRSIFYHGVETQTDFSIAFSYMGDVQIELIQPINDHPSAYKDFLDSGREGLHHIAYWPQDLDAACDLLEAQGFVENTSIRTPQGERSVMYYETPPHLGIVIELVPLTKARADYFRRIQRLSETWDGVTRAIRRFPSRPAFLASDEGLG